MEEPFIIHVDLFQAGTVSELDVIPGESSWLIILDGVTFGNISHDGEHRWIWLDEGLSHDEDVAETIGYALEMHYK